MNVPELVKRVGRHAFDIVEEFDSTLMRCRLRYGGWVTIEALESQYRRNVDWPKHTSHVAMLPEYGAPEDLERWISAAEEHDRKHPPGSLREIPWDV